MEEIVDKLPYIQESELHEGGNIRKLEIEEHKYRVHGFEWPWNEFQISLYTLFISNVTIFFAILRTELHFQIVNVLLIIPMVITCFLATYLNPEDPVV